MVAMTLINQASCCQTIIESKIESKYITHRPMHKVFLGNKCSKFKFPQNLAKYFILFIELFLLNYKQKLFITLKTP